MWVKSNADGTYTIYNSLAFLDNGKVVIVDSESDKTKTYNGFKWESNQGELNRMAAVNGDYADTAKDDKDGPE